VGSIPGRPNQQFFNPGLQKKINKALSVRVIAICSGHKLLWRDSYKGAGCASTSPESILHKIIIIINSKRAPPKQWSNYTTASTAMWLYNTPDTRLSIDLRASADVNDRRPAIEKFCDDSTKKIGRQVIRNRLNRINTGDFGWIKNNIFKDYWRVHLTKTILLLLTIVCDEIFYKFLRQVYL